AGLEAEIEAGRVEHGEREAEVDRLRRETRTLQEDVQRLEAEVVAVRRAEGAARERSNALDVQIAERRARCDSLIANTRERHGAEVESLEVPEGFVAEGAGERIEVLKQKIASLGEVNVTAIAEAGELEER